ncbi:MAG: ComF family protein [Candidatus Kapaibacteriota bacterium]
MKFLNNLLDAFNFVISPPICVLCSTLIDTSLCESEHICNDCYRNLPPAIESKEILNRFAVNFTNYPNPFEYAFSLFNSRDNHKYLEIIHYLKYTKYKKIGYFLGRKLGQKINNILKEGNLQIDFIVPVPIHKVRKRERGFNQSEVISESISIETGIPVGNDILVRNIYTQSQTKLDLEGRKKNVESAFSLGKDFGLVYGNNFLIVDDVITTGSTLFYCARILKETGAKNLYLAVITTA